MSHLHVSAGQEILGNKMRQWMRMGRHGGHYQVKGRARSGPSRMEVDSTAARIGLDRDPKVFVSTQEATEQGAATVQTRYRQTTSWAGSAG